MERVFGVTECAISQQIKCEGEQSGAQKYVSLAKYNDNLTWCVRFMMRIQAKAMHFLHFQTSEGFVLNDVFGGMFL